MTESGLSGECQDGRGLVGPRAIALSPDGENAYVADEAWDSVATLTRDGGSGALSPISSPSGCLSMTPNYDDCADGRALGGARDVAVSPDGKNVYVAAATDDAVAVLDRDAGDGHLTQSSGDDGCVSAGGSGECGEGNALDEPTSVAVSPDGKTVYVASKGPGGGIAIFERDPDTGDLSQDPGTAGCVSDADRRLRQRARPRCRGSKRSRSAPTASPSTGSPPPATRSRSSRRDTEPGELTPVPAPDGCIVSKAAEGCTVATGLGDPRAIAFARRERLRRLGTARRDPRLRPRRHLREADPEAGDRGVRQQHRPLGPDAERHRRGVRQRRRDGRDQLGRRPRRRVRSSTRRRRKRRASSSSNAPPTGRSRSVPGTAGCTTETGLEDPEPALDRRNLRRRPRAAAGQRRRRQRRQPQRLHLGPARWGRQLRRRRSLRARAAGGRSPTASARRQPGVRERPGEGAEGLGRD